MTCKFCKHWKSPYNGMWDEEEYGSCEVLSISGWAEYDDVRPVIQGCVSVYDEDDSFEFVTGKNFGCNKYEDR